MSVEPWKRIDPTVVTKIDYRHIVVKTFEVPGKDKKLTIATFLGEGARSAGVVALTTDKKVIVARQFRHGPERIMDEIPGGGVNPGEDPEVGARRELLEETGYVPGAIELLGTSSRDAYSNGTWYYYLATDCSPHPDGQQLDEDELVEVKRISIDQFIQNALEDKMSDPHAVLLAYEKLLKMKEGKHGASS